MKKLYYILIIFFFPFFSFAQTQKGIVKTRGRMINGQLVSGDGLNDATIKLDCGRNMTSKQVGKDKGVFSFPVPSQSFRVIEVLKKGYQLVDADAVSRTRRYSTEPLYLVMETPEQQQEDKIVAERKIRRTLTRQLQEREDEIELLKSQNKLSQEAYQKAMQQLYAEQQSNEKLISDMANEYAVLDYDQMDDFYRQVAYCIENGHLSKADSLLRSKGDVNVQVEEQLKRGQAIQQAKEEITKAEAVHEAGNEELAQRCYRFYETFKMKHQNDSAAHYLELRARLNSTNSVWQNEAGVFISDYIADYSLALTYYQRALRHALAQYGEKNYLVATSYNNIGGVYSIQGLYTQALEYYQKALEIRREVLGERHSDVALSYNNIGYVFYCQGSYTLALEYYQKALEIRKEALGERHSDVAVSYNNIGAVYHRQNSYTLALEYYQKALEIYKEVYSERHPGVARSYNNIGAAFHYQGSYTQALEYYQKALEIRREVLGERHPDVATNYNNIGAVYVSLGSYPQAIEYLQKALEIRKQVLGERHPETREAQENLIVVKYILAISRGDMKSFCEENCFIVTIVDGNSPARQQGMEGEYILLEFADWNQNSPTSLFDKFNELRGKPKDILVLKNSKITQYHFENNIGAQLGLKCVGKEERQRINKAYEEWKSKIHN